MKNMVRVIFAGLLAAEGTFRNQALAATPMVSVG